MKQYSSHGKFLITGEYLILSGAAGLALPLTKTFQQLTVTPGSNNSFHWMALDQDNQLWFEAVFSQDLDVKNTSDNSRGQKLGEILRELKDKRPDLFTKPLDFQTHMNFSPAWGLGSSSTLISNLAAWSEQNAYELQRKFFGGSGYDIACAQSSSPLIFQLRDGLPSVTLVKWVPSFKQNLYFLYLEKKQDSREAMAGFKAHTPHPKDEDIQQISELTQKFLMASDLLSFKILMREHELLIGRLLNRIPVKEKHFSDFAGEIKSLGGWGGDFVLVASSFDPTEYFASKGYPLVKKWDELV